jgi:hypothetical protein
MLCVKGYFGIFEINLDTDLYCHPDRSGFRVAQLGTEGTERMKERLVLFFLPRLVLRLMLRSVATTQSSERVLRRVVRKEGREEKME